jgi:hypothetical protein
MTTQPEIPLIETAEECSRIVERVLISQSMLAIDCEGVYLSKEGALTLVQICTPTGEIYIFDILKGGPEMFSGKNKLRGLKFIFESKKILKLVHDCRSDWDSLLYQFNVRLYNFIDTQEVYYVFKLFYYQEITLPISLMRFIEQILGVKLEHKSAMKNKMATDPEIWGKRPINKEELIYAAEDVKFLIATWSSIKSKFNDNLIEIISFLSILKVIDFPMFHQFKEFLFANVIYYSMLENVFINEEEVYSYIFNVDYVYSFLQFKILADSEREEKLINIRNDVVYKSVMSFKQKQQLLNLSKLKQNSFTQIQSSFKTISTKNKVYKNIQKKDYEQTYTNEDKENCNPNSNSEDKTTSPYRVGKKKYYYPYYFSNKNQKFTQHNKFKMKKLNLHIYQQKESSFLNKKMNYGYGIHESSKSLYSIDSTEEYKY